MADEPLFATLLGNRRFDDALPDVTPAARSRRERWYASIIERSSTIDEDTLSEGQKLTRSALLVDAQSQLDYSLCGLGEWVVDPLQGPQVEFMNVESYQPVATPAEGFAMVKRWAAVGPYFESHIANLKRGEREKKVSTRVCVEKVIDELQALLSKPDSEWAFLRPLSVPHRDWSEREVREFGGKLTTAFRKSVRPAYARYVRFLKSEILPRSRPQERPGIVHLPGGPEAYSRLIKVHTSLELSPEELHRTGLSEVARINREMNRLGEKVFGTSDRRETLARLRTDPSLHFTTRDEVEKKAREALSRAKSAIPNWFGRLPRADCEVVVMGEHEEKHSTTAYYRQPAADGSRPGQYCINTSEPETRPRYEAEVLAYHESIPGHHLQIAIAQELEGIPEFRKNSGVTAFVEGWGLYSERLADKMRLYSSDLDRIGVLSFDSWRACRLVVDTGMHSMGWTRQQAIRFMTENTALAQNNIINEVDRYITWPGQALAYKIGQLEMMRLRHRAERRLGKGFDIKRFHDALLGGGAVPLKVLRRMIENYGEKELKQGK
jgi:uncharacterized protein (DUF885 family)